jgi:biofilm PGA synthesis N-glycosyltransferase PgaC
MSRDYLIISPCRNEAGYMRTTLECIEKQSVLPKLWLIVDDGSTDETPQILAEFAQRHPWVQVLTREDRGHRAVGPGVIEAFYAGYDSVDVDQFTYLCKLDLDLEIPPLYFERLMERMEANPKIATCSGKSYIRLPDGTTRFERHGDETSLGMTKFYRVTHFKTMGGFVREVMWDGIDCHRCRMLGLIACSWDEPDLRFIHLRPMGSSQQGILTGRMRHGFGQYFMGTGFLFMLASALTRLNDKPFVLGSLAMLWGWCGSALRGDKRYPDLEFRAYLRRFQRMSLFMGKRKAVEKLYLEKGVSL